MARERDVDDTARNEFVDTRAAGSAFPDGVSIARAPSSLSSAADSSLPDANLSFLAFLRHRATTATAAAGAPGHAASSGSGSLWSTAYSTAMLVSPAKGRTLGRTPYRPRSTWFLR